MSFAYQETVFWALALFWLQFSVVRWLASGGVKYLPSSTRHPGTHAPPRVSVVVAARNEERRISGTVSRLLAQTGVDLELIVVDDRSTDRTAAILAPLPSRHPQLRVITIERLPEDWMGKPHALHVGSQRATGDWLLFTDGDTWISPDVVARAVAAAEDERADQVCLFPGEGSPSAGGKAILVFLSTTFGSVAAAANRDRRWAAVGVGAFNLVRAEAYRTIGGHEPLKYEVIDDVKLGLLLRRAGLRARVFDANRDVEVEWAPTLSGFFRAIEKNLYALLEFNPVLAAIAMVLPTLVWGLTVAAPLTGSPAGIAAGACLAGTAFPAMLAARRAGFGAVYGLPTPLLPPLFALSVGWSTFKTLRQGGIVWRGTRYPLDRLRRGLVRVTRGPWPPVR